MSLSAAAVTGSSFNAQIIFPQVSPLAEDLNITLPLAWSNVSNIINYVGTFTPSDSVLNLVVGLTFASGFNFLLIIVDGQTNLLADGVSIIMSVQRFSFASFVTSSSAYPTSIQIDGRVSPAGGLVTMPQGIPINYSITTGFATLS